MDQYIIRIITDPDGVDWEMYEAQYATKGPATGEKWFNCTICGDSFPKSKMAFKGGAPFCIPHRCYLDKDEPRTGGKV